jgi:hypothetical protein
VLAKAKLVEVRWTGDPPQSEVVPGGKEVPVQFNPESLKLNFANDDNSRGQSSPGQTTGSGTSKLAVELVFDTTTTGTDVRRNTEDIAYFIKAPRDRSNRPVQPGMGFEWGSFIFRGVVKSMDETLDYFSEEGVPLRANISLSVAQPNIEFIPAPAGGGAGGGPGAGQGTGATAPLAPAGANDNVQKLAARNGKSSDWKAIASVNKIDDPLRLRAGVLINVNAKVDLKRRS